MSMCAFRGHVPSLMECGLILKKQQDGKIPTLDKEKVDGIHARICQISTHRLIDEVVERQLASEVP